MATPPTLIDQLAEATGRGVDELREQLAGIGDKMAVLGEVSERAREIEQPDHAYVGWTAAVRDVASAVDYPGDVRPALVTVAAAAVNWILQLDRAAAAKGTVGGDDA